MIVRRSQTLSIKGSGSWSGSRATWTVQTSAPDPFVGASAGGDLAGRIIAPRLSEVLGRSVVVENIGAAGGTTGSARVAKAPPDGYTFLIGNSGTHAYSQSLYKTKPYDAAADFEPNPPADRRADRAGERAQEHDAVALADALPLDDLDVADLMVAPGDDPDGHDGGAGAGRDERRGTEAGAAVSVRLHDAHGEAHRRLQIGRAACRERV